MNEQIPQSEQVTLTPHEQELMGKALTVEGYDGIRARQELLGSRAVSSQVTPDIPSVEPQATESKADEQSNSSK